MAKISSAVLQEFHNKNYTIDRTVLMGLDIDHDLLVKYGEQISLPKSSNVSSLASKFHAGEVRIETGGNQAFLAVAANCASAASVKEAVATRLLQHILGQGPRVAYGNCHGKLQKASGSNAVSAINYSYSDAGLLGAYIASDAQSAGKVSRILVLLLAI